MEGRQAEETKNTDLSAETAKVSFLSLANTTLRARRWILVGMLVGVLIGVFYVLYAREYVATAAFAPETGRSEASRLAGIAAQFGVDILPGGESEAPEFYVAVLRSQDLLQELLRSRFAPREGGETAPLIELLGVSGGNEHERFRNGVEVLRSRITTGVDQRAGVISVNVRAPWPHLAEDLAKALLEMVNRFNLEKRRSRAAAEREFIEDRIESARKELAQVEAELESFLEANRSVGESPRLVFERERLQRRVDLRQQVYLSLAQSFEQARIEEVRNTPLVTVLDSPSGTAEPTGSIPIAVIVGALLGASLAAGLAFGRDYFRVVEREDREEYAEFQRLLGEIRRPLARRASGEPGASNVGRNASA